MSGVESQLRKLLKQGRYEEAARTTVDGVSILEYLLKAGNFVLAAELVDAGLPIDQLSDLSGEAVLTTFSKRGVVRCVDWLLACGALPDGPPGQDATPLFYASMYGHHEIVNLLMSAGADPNKKSIHGSTPLDVAANVLVAENLMRRKGSGQA